MQYVIDTLKTALALKEVAKDTEHVDEIKSAISILEGKPRCVHCSVAQDNLNHNVLDSKIIQALQRHSHDYEPGFEGWTDIVIKELVTKDEIEAMQSLFRIFSHSYLYSSLEYNKAICLAIVRVISRLTLVQSNSKSLFFSIIHIALTIKDDEIIEGCVRALENWPCDLSISLLQGAKIETEWIDDYRKQVIKDLL